MLAFLTLILPFIWHYGLGAILLGAAVVLWMLTAFKKVAIAIAAGVVVALIVYSIGIANGTNYERAKLVAYKAQVQAEIAAEKERQRLNAAAAIATLETELDAAEAEAFEAQQDAADLRALIANNPANPGRGATDADVNILNR